MRSAALFTLLAVLAGPALSAAMPGSGPAAQPSPVIAAYVFPDGTTLQPGQVDPHAVTRIIYAFATLDKNGTIAVANAQDAGNLTLLASLREQNPDLQVLISVGGWNGSGHFSDAALTEESRRAFVRSAIDLIQRYNLDGLDVDWEYPGQPGAGNKFRSEDKQNFTLLLKGLREGFERETERTHKKLYLTIAAEAAEEYLAHTEMDKVRSYVDDVNLMAYDYYVPGADKTTGNSAPLFDSPQDPKQVSADRSVRRFEQAGVPAEKIVLGVPFFGRAWMDVDQQEHGLFQKGKAGPIPYLPYGAIMQTMLGHGYARYWDPQAMVPYLYNAQQKVFVSYEDEKSLAAKCKYAVEHNLGGVMFWHYSEDPSGVLLRTIDLGLRTPAEANSAGAATARGSRGDQ